MAEKERNILSALSSGEGFKKLIILVAVCAAATVLYFPTLTFRGFSYSAGDVALSDVKSPAGIEAEGIVIRKGETIVRDGQVVTESEIKKLGLIETALKEKTRALPAAGFFAFAAVFIAAVYWFAARNIRKFSNIPKDLLLMGVIFIGCLMLLRLTGFEFLKSTLHHPAAYAFIIPIAVGPMLVRLLLNSETALVFAAVTSVMAGLFTGGDLDMTAYTLIGGSVAATGVRHCTHRSIVIRAGLILGVVNAVVLLSLYALKGVPASGPFSAIASGLLNGIITSILAVGFAPVFESAFRYTTNIKLLELSRMDHPLLKELAMRAPGTYHHSILIGTLVEAAAEAINANPLLARVAAYYHDVGKMKMPEYFIENLKHYEENKHDRLAPSMSALIISNHIKEGAELAGDYRLGSEITDIIRQHHGSSLVAFFYQKARSQEEVDSEVDEETFRYPGPKPQTKEAGLVMLADAIEAASKTIPDPTPDKIQWLTQKIVNKVFADGQLDECELTLKDLHAITRSFNRVLAGIYHQRIDYPEPAYVEGDHAQGFGERRSGEKARGEGKEDGRDRLKRLGI